MHRAVVHWSLRQATVVVALTRYQKKTMAQNGLPDTAARIVPLGVDSLAFPYCPRIRATSVRLLSVASLNRVKDPFTLVKTYAILRTRIECTLTVIGPDVLDGEVQRYAGQLGIEANIEWRGQQPHSEIRRVMCAADLLLVTSLYEGQSVVAMEAFATGLLVAGTSVGLLADASDTGAAVDPGDAEGLADAVIRLLSDPATAERVRLSNRKFAEHFSADWTSNQYRQIYTDLLTDKNQAAHLSEMAAAR
jgi:glycosyltransferase involved in cell wall biosynthesis